MMQALAVAISGTLATIAIVHAHWGIGGHWPASTAHDLALTVVGAPGIKRMPSPAASRSEAAGYAWMGGR